MFLASSDDFQWMSFDSFFLSNFKLAGHLQSIGRFKNCQSSKLPNPFCCLLKSFYEIWNDVVRGAWLLLLRRCFCSRNSWRVCCCSPNNKRALLSTEILPIFLRLLCSGVALKRRLLPTRASKADFYFCALDKSVHCVRDML